MTEATPGALRGFGHPLDAVHGDVAGDDPVT
jgi:hypothetical protein